MIRIAILLLAGLLAASAAPAQSRRGRPAQEFTRQEILISNFAVDAGADVRAARRVADALRSRLDRLLDDREVRVIPGNDLRSELRFASFPPDSALSRGDLRLLGAKLRADEFVVGYGMDLAERYRNLPYICVLPGGEPREPG